MDYCTRNGVVVTPSKKFHEHSQVTESLLKVASWGAFNDYRIKYYLK